MNLLIDKFPKSVEVGGKKYDIETDFRACLKIMLAFEDQDLTDLEKRLIMISRIYKGTPPDSPEAFEKAIWFLNCGKINNSEESDNTRLYSFEKDAEYIYSGIRQTHGIDLESVDYMHWWKFTILFMSIDETCFFNKLVALRSKKLKGKLSKEESIYCNEIHEIIELPQIVSSEEAVALDDFYSQLNC